MSERGNEKTRVLFVCTGNACRSQMAEAWAGALKLDSLEAYSAGTHPAAMVSTRALEVMEEVGIDMSGHYTKAIEGWSDLQVDYVVCLCDNARVHMPALAEGVPLVHYPVPDPMGLLGSDGQTMDAFRRTRDKIKSFVQTLPGALTQAATS